MPAACIQLRNYDLSEKAQLKLSSFKTFSSRIISQNHMLGISFLNKNVTKLLHPPGVDCSPFRWTFMGNPGDGEQSYPTAKHLLISLISKISFNKFKYFAVKSFISSTSNSNFEVIILCNLNLQLQSFLSFHILIFRLYVSTCHANLTNQCLLNVAFSMRKALNNRSFPKQNFHSLYLSIPSLAMLFWKPCFY